MQLKKVLCFAMVFILPFVTVLTGFMEPVSVQAETAKSLLLSKGKPATADCAEGDNPAGNANDGDSNNTRWSADDGAYPHWWKVDLEGEKELTSIVIKWYKARAYLYNIEVSNDDVTYEKIVDKENNTTADVTTDEVSITARYIKVNVTGVVGDEGYAGFYECSVYGVGDYVEETAEEGKDGEKPKGKAIPNMLISKGKSVTASSEQNNAEGVNPASNAVDGSNETRWAPSDGGFPQWWRVDLGYETDITKIDIKWYKQDCIIIRLDLSNG